MLIDLARKVPRTVYVLNLVELMERWGWYALGTGVLTYYIQSYFKLSAAEAGFAFSVFYALLYLATLAGGRVADRFLGRTNAVALGLAMLAAGYFTMRRNALLGASLVICGNGLFKPNMTTLLGEQIPRNAGKGAIDLAFWLFYGAINIGGLIGPILSGPAEARGDYEAMFMTAYAPVAFGMVLFLAMRGRFEAGAADTYDEMDDATWRRRRAALLLVDLSAVFFWTAFHLAPTMLASFTKDMTDRKLFGYEISPGTVSGLNSFFVLTLTPVLVLFFDGTAFGRKFDIVKKMLVGMALTTSAYVTLALACHLHPRGGAGMGWIVAIYLQLTLGELFVSPMGSSMMSQNSKKESAGFMMGLWQCSVAVGTLISGLIVLTWGRVPYWLSAAAAAAAPAVGFAVMYKWRRHLRRNLKGEVRNTAKDDAVPPGKLSVKASGA